MFAAISIFVFSLIIFIPGVSHSVYGGDSGDIILASWFGGVAHPPGYPLNTIIGWIFSHLPFDAAIAYKANLAAAFIQSVNSVLVFLIVTKISSKKVIGMISAFLFMFNPLIWLYAHVYEVFQLNLALIAITFYLLLLWQETVLNHKQKKSYLYLAFFSWGLSAFHHHTSILLAPAILIFILNVRRNFLKQKMELLKLSGLFVLGSIQYIFILYAAFRQTPINWNNPVNVENFIRLITRADYGTFTSANFLVSSTLKQKAAHVINYGLFLKADFLVVGLFLIFVGFTYSFFKQKAVFWFLFLGFVALGPFFLAYSAFPLSNDFYSGLWERFLLNSYLLLLITLGLGLVPLYSKIVTYLSQINFPTMSKRSRIVLFCGILAFLPIYYYLINQPKTDLSNFKLGDWYAEDIMQSAEPGAIILLVGDTALFNTLYVYYTFDKYTDLKPIRAGSLAFIEYREQVSKEFKDLTVPPEFLNEEAPDTAKFLIMLINANKEKFPIYIRDFEPPIDDYRWISVGLLKKLIPQSGDLEGDSYAKINSERFGKFKFNDFSQRLGYTHYITNHIKEQYYPPLIGISAQLAILGKVDQATSYLQKAVELYPEKKEAHILLGQLNYEKRNCIESKQHFEKVISIDFKEWRALEALATLEENCFLNPDRANELLKESEMIRRNYFEQSID